jgi:pimeloyl-ACP methyl ester carboxylesterase
MRRSESGSIGAPSRFPVRYANGHFVVTADPVIEIVELIAGRLWRLEVAGRKPVNRRAVVFVHGFTGNAENTWRADELESFPYLLARDPKFQDYDIFLFQYATSFFFPPEIKNIVNQFEFALEKHLPGHSIVFIAHSMGGLVCMQYVLRQLERAAVLRVVGLLTYGTPMSGVEWIRYANLVLQLTAIKIPLVSTVSKFFTKNRQLENMRAGGQFIDALTSNWVLRVLNGGYPSIPANLRTWLPTRVVTGNDDWVVKESSAKGFYGDIDWVPVDKGHIAMIKPAGRKDESYEIASDFVTQCRVWIGPASALKLRRQADLIWNLHKCRRIANWTLELSFLGREPASGAEFGLPGFGEFTVRECSYTRFFDEPILKFGFAFGSIASDKTWSDQFLFLHRLLFRGLSKAESSKIIESLRPLLNNPGKAWKILFRDLRVSVGTGRDSVELQPRDPVAVDDGIVCDIDLPKEFVGKEERVKLSFTSLLPMNIRHYRIWFPWLCESFSATVSFEREVAFLAAYQAMRGSMEASAREEAYGKMGFQSSELILPESYIQMEWRFSEQERTTT